MIETIDLDENFRKKLKRRFPFYSLPQLKNYNEFLRDYSQMNNCLPYVLKMDINYDGCEELVFIQKSIFNKKGRLLVVYDKDNLSKSEVIYFEQPFNATYRDYGIKKAEPNTYSLKGLNQATEIKVSLPHISLFGYESRIIFWDGEHLVQKKV